MALVQLTDVVIPEVFAPYVQVLTTEKTAFVQSGIMETGEFFNSLLQGGGRTFSIPHWRDLANDEPNVSDDSENSAIPKKLGTGEEVAQRHNVNQAWKAADLVTALAGDDPMDAIAQRVSSYWSRVLQTRVIRTLQGLFADNDANDSGDMTESIVSLSGTVTDDNRFNAPAFLQAAATLGDRADEVTAIAMHSMVFTQAQVNNLIEFIPDSRGETQIPTFLGRRVIVDDGMPTATISGHTVYDSYLFGAGALAYGTAEPRVPVAVQREELQGNGGGTEILVSRQQHLIHPRGFAWLGASMAGEAATYAELASGVNWNRVFAERKQVKLARLRTNG